MLTVAGSMDVPPLCPFLRPNSGDHFPPLAQFVLLYPPFRPPVKGRVEYPPDGTAASHAPISQSDLRGAHLVSHRRGRSSADSVVEHRPISVPPPPPPSRIFDERERHCRRRNWRERSGGANSSIAIWPLPPSPTYVPAVQACVHHHSRRGPWEVLERGERSWSACRRGRREELGLPRHALCVLLRQTGRSISRVPEDDGADQ